MASKDKTDAKGTEYVVAFNAVGAHSRGDVLNSSRFEDYDFEGLLATGAVVVKDSDEHKALIEGVNAVNGVEADNKAPNPADLDPNRTESPPTSPVAGVEPPPTSPDEVKVAQKALDALASQSNGSL